MYRLILKHCCLFLLFFVIGNNCIYAQSKSNTPEVKARVTLAGKDSGNISVTILKGIKSLAINAPYKIDKFIIVINDNKPGAKPLSFYNLSSKDFSSDVMNDLASRGVDFTFILDEIKVKDVKGNIIKVPPAVFHVIADK